MIPARVRRALEAALDRTLTEARAQDWKRPRVQEPARADGGFSLAAGLTRDKVLACWADDRAAERGEQARAAIREGRFDGALSLVEQAAKLEAEHSTPGAWAQLAEELTQAVAAHPPPRPAPPPQPVTPAPEDADGLVLPGPVPEIPTASPADGAGASRELGPDLVLECAGALQPGEATPRPEDPGADPGPALGLVPGPGGATPDDPAGDPPGAPPAGPPQPDPGEPGSVGAAPREPRAPRGGGRRDPLLNPEPKETPMTIPPLTPFEARELLRLLVSDPALRPLVVTLCELSGLAGAPSDPAAPLQMVMVQRAEKAAPKPRPAKEKKEHAALARVRATVCRAFEVEEGDLGARKGQGALARRAYYHLAQQALGVGGRLAARALGIPTGTISNSANRIHQEMKADKALAAKVEKLRAELAGERQVAE